MDVVKVLLDSGADWNIENELGNRPLDEACSRQDSFNCAEVLAEWGRDHNPPVSEVEAAETELADADIAETDTTENDVAESAKE